MRAKMDWRRFVRLCPAIEAPSASTVLSGLSARLRAGQVYSVGDVSTRWGKLASAAPDRGEWTSSADKDAERKSTTSSSRSRP